MVIKKFRASTLGPENGSKIFHLKKAFPLYVPSRFINISIYLISKKAFENVMFKWALLTSRNRCAVHISRNKSKRHPRYYGLRMAEQGGNLCSLPLSSERQLQYIIVFLNFWHYESRSLSLSTYTLNHDDCEHCKLTSLSFIITLQKITSQYFAYMENNQSQRIFHAS